MALSKSSTGKTNERDEVLKRMLKMKPKPHKPGDRALEPKSEKSTKGDVVKAARASHKRSS